MKKVSEAKRLLETLKTRHSATRKELESLGFKFVSQNMRELRIQGHNIATERVDNNTCTKYIYIDDKNKVKKEETNPVVDVVKEQEGKVIKPMPKTLKGAVLEYLIEHGKISQVEASKKLGAFNLSHIIMELRKDGYEITRSKGKEYKTASTKADRNLSYCIYYLNRTKNITKTKYILTEINYFKLPVGESLTEPLVFDTLDEVKNKINELVNKNVQEFSALFSIISPNTEIVRDDTIFSIIAINKEKKLFRTIKNKTVLKTYLYTPTEYSVLGYLNK